LKECNSIIQEALKEGRNSLLIHEAGRICELHNIPTPKSYVARSAQDAVSRIDEIGFPVALKIISPQILHKSDVGGVILNINSVEELRSAYSRLIAGVTMHEPKAEIIGVFVEKMMPPSTEVIVGGIRDRQFGPSVMLGIGGIFAEVYGDVAFRIAPIDRVDALNLIHELKGSKLLEGTRGKPPADLDALVDILIKTSKLMLEHSKLNQLDLNPVIVYQKGACSVDFRMVLEQEYGGTKVES
jgi:acetyl-CoA synthetase (ADP-forming)